MSSHGLNFNSLSKGFDALNKNFMGGMGESLDSGFASPVDRQIHNTGVPDGEGMLHKFNY